MILAFTIGFKNLMVLVIGGGMLVLTGTWMTANENEHEENYKKIISKFVFGFIGVPFAFVFSIYFISQIIFLILLLLLSIVLMNVWVAQDMVGELNEAWEIWYIDLICPFPTQHN